MINQSNNGDNTVNRREFVNFCAMGMAAVGAASITVPLLDSFNPSADVLAMSSTEVKISSVQPGQEMRVMWRGKPIFIRRRTAEEIKIAQDIEVASLIDPQLDSDRVKKGKEEWLILIGICTHLGCVPQAVFSKTDDGWFCPCHGSKYDTSGRVIKGPAPLNLAVPPYQFINDDTIKIG
jgi:ubiquinol-cytochrome c reductase iron-sulfur subunit